MPWNRRSGYTLRMGYENIRNTQWIYHQEPIHRIRGLIASHERESKPKHVLSAVLILSLVYANHRGKDDTCNKTVLRKNPVLNEMNQPFTVEYTICFFLFVTKIFSAYLKRYRAFFIRLNWANVFKTIKVNSPSKIWYICIRLNHYNISVDHT